MVVHILLVKFKPGSNLNKYLKSFFFSFHFYLTGAKHANGKLLWLVSVRRPSSTVVCQHLYINMFSSKTAHCILIKLFSYVSWSTL